MNKYDFEKYYESLQEEEGGEIMSESTEAPKSISSVIYYRGVSTTITRREDDVDIKPSLEKQFAMIDWALDEKECKPSWNPETNKVAMDKDPDWVKQPALAPTQTQDTSTQELGNCRRCGAPNKLSKQGKAYCSKTCWLKTQ